MTTKKSYRGLFVILLLLGLTVSFSTSMVFTDASIPFVALPFPADSSSATTPFATFASTADASAYVDQRITEAGNATLHITGHNPSFSQQIASGLVAALQVDKAFALGRHDQIKAAFRAYTKAWQASTDIQFQWGGAIFAFVISLLSAWIAAYLLTQMTAAIEERRGLLGTAASIWSQIRALAAGLRKNWREEVARVNARPNGT